MFAEEDEDEDVMRPGDWCDDCREYVASDGVCYCGEDEDD